MTESPVDAVLEYADTIFYDGQVITVDDDETIAEAVAISDGRFVAVGSTAEVRELAGPDTVERDLSGDTVIPGLIDSHIHVALMGRDLAQGTLFEARSIDDILEVVENAAANTSDGEWVQTAWGWHESQLAENRLPNRDELDEVAPENPVFVPRGGHVASLNSAGLERVGIDEETPDPSGGTIVRGPETGRPTGVVMEAARRELVEPELPNWTYDEKVASVERAMQELNSCGVTAALEPGPKEDDVLRAFQQVHDEGNATVRTDVLVRVHERDDIQEMAKYLSRGFGDEMLKVGGIKFLIDGGVEGGQLSEPYEIVEGIQEKEEYYGEYYMPPGEETELIEMFEIAADRGYQVQTHAVGDAAIGKVLDVYEAAANPEDIESLRWTVMHLFLPTESHLDRMEELGVLPTVQNHPSYLGENMVRLWGEERAERAIPIRTLLERGFVIGGGTDAPVVPWWPFESIYWMVTRETVTAGVLGPEQGIDREDALRLWTRDAAYTMHWEDEIGSIEPGKRADLVVLNRDFFDVPQSELRDVDAKLTMVGGDIVYER